MTHVERIAFAMWKSGFPDHVSNDLSLETLGVVQKPLGGDCIGEQDLALDWQLNRDAFLKLAAAALVEIQAIIDEAQGRST